MPKQLSFYSQSVHVGVLLHHVPAARTKRETAFKVNQSSAFDALTPIKISFCFKEMFSHRDDISDLSSDHWAQDTQLIFPLQEL